MNICEPEINPYYDGNRIWGLKFKTESNVVSVAQGDETYRFGYKIHNAFPNPFNGLIKLSYQISEPGSMTISIFNVMGQKVRTLFDGEVDGTGDHTVFWDGIDEAGNSVSTGTYFVIFQPEGHVPGSQKILFLK